MEGNERATHGLELLELFIENNICCPFLLLVNQWRFMVQGPRYLGTIHGVDSSICKNWGICHLGFRAQRSSPQAQPQGFHLPLAKVKPGHAWGWHRSRRGGCSMVRRMTSDPPSTT